MPSARTARRLLALAVGAAAVVAPVVLAAPAQAAGERTVVGQLVQAWPETAGGGTTEAAEPLSWVQPASGEPVRVPTDDVAGVPAGATLRVTVGAAVADSTPAAAGDVDPAHAVVSSSVVTTPPATPVVGTDEVTVVAADTSAAAGEVTRGQLTDAVTGPVADFWSSQTGGRVRLAVADSLTWTPTAPLDCSSPTSVWAAAAAAAGFTPGPGKHLLVHLADDLPGVAGCAYGLAEVGRGIGSGGDLWVRDALPSLLAHELGHNLGLGHSSGEQCDGAVDTGDCRVLPYRDWYDVMGASWEHVGTLTVAQQARLGVLPAAQQQVLDAAGPGGPVTLAPLGGHAGSRALELTAAGGTAYWLEYRAATGQDAWLAGNRLGLQAGVLVHRAGDLPDTSLLLDATPSAVARQDDVQAALPLGRPVALADGLTVTLTAADAAGATVTVTTTPAAAPAPAPAAAAPAQRPATLPARGATGRAGATAGNASAGAGRGPADGAVVAPGPAATAPASGSAAAPGDGVRTRPAALARSSRPPLPLAGCAVIACAVLGGLAVAARRRLRHR